MTMTTASTSVLADQLRERIRREGPITFRDWMDAALYDPLHGYYFRADRQRWGREGDYRTSPERSSLFASTLARYVAKLYDEDGKSSSLSIAEYGAGDGQFAASLLTALENYFPHVFIATRYSIFERSSQSERLAQKRLLPFGDRVSFSPEEPHSDFSIVFSNELLDAFPVHRVKMDGGHLREFYVDVLESGEFEWTLAEPSTPALTALF